MTDERVLVRPTAAQKPERGSSIISTPPQHWNPAIWEHACMVSDAFPSLVSRIVAIWSPGCSLLLKDKLPLPPSAPSFPPPPHRRDDDRNHCVRADVRCCTWFNNNPSVSYCQCRVCSFRCLSICVAAKCRILKWVAGCESKQADGTIPLDHACPCPSCESVDVMDQVR